MLKKVVEISSPARLRVEHAQLVIQREEAAAARIPCEDIGVLLVDHPAVVYTHAVFTLLAEQGAAVALCGRDHLPTALVLPVVGHHAQAERRRAQLEASAPLKKRIWQGVVRSKLARQGVLLARLTGADAGLGALSKRVRSGDPDNLEAQGAQRYWPALMGGAFRRRRDGAPPNDWLNYGYMALRAAMARALVGAGLLPCQGVFHRNRRNPFALADDLLEPYRPFVDWRVQAMHARGLAAGLDRGAKAELLSLFHEGVVVRDGRMPLFSAIQATAASLAASFEQGRAEVIFPSGWIIEDETDDAEKDS